jgi:hypothetical protein
VTASVCISSTATITEGRALALGTSLRVAVADFSPKMGFLPLRDNLASWHSIYAHSEAAFATGVIDRRLQPAAAAAR